MRSELMNFIDYDEGKRIRKELHEEAKNTYIPKHTSDHYMSFMNSNPCTFVVCHAQSENHPWYYSLFTVSSQWVYGDVIEECLDNAISRGNVINGN